jgi:hypothetical protein
MQWLDEIAGCKSARLCQEPEEPLQSELSDPARWALFYSDQVLKRCTAAKDDGHVQGREVTQNPLFLVRHSHANHQNVWREVGDAVRE